MPTLNISKQELAILLKLLAIKVDSIISDSSSGDNLERYYSIFSKLYAFGETIRFKDSVQLLLVNEDNFEKQEKKEKLLKSEIRYLPLPNRVKNALIFNGIMLLRELIVLNPQELIKFRKVGPSIVIQIELFLKENGLEFLADD